MAPLPLNKPSIAGITLFLFSVAFGISSIALTAVSWDENYQDMMYYDHDYSSAHIAALVTGGLCLLTAVLAYPLTFTGAQNYMRERNSRGIQGLMIASWVLYGIMVLNGVLAIALGAADDNEAPETGWVVAIVTIMVIGWILMFVHAETARKSPDVTSFSQDVVRPQPVEPPMDTVVAPNVITTVTTTVNKDGTHTRKTVKRTTNPDGSITVQETVELCPQDLDF
jgi:hypothetical protein